jgi:thymidylate synthase (FAD)
MEVIILTDLTQYAVEDMIDKMYTAARCCYNPGTCVELITDAQNTKTTEDKIKLIQKVLDSGHQSIAEHVSITFCIDGISRSASHQLVRHRLCTYSQQSQRYCDLSKNEIDWIIPDSIRKDEYAMAAYNEALRAIEKAYCYCVDVGIKAEDARYILPNACPTNIVVTTNLRNLFHVMGLRCCNRAQWEIRAVFKELSAKLCAAIPFLAKYFKANCDQWGFCPEGRPCGKTPTLKQILENKPE